LDFSLFAFLKKKMSTTNKIADVMIWVIVFEFSRDKDNDFPIQKTAIAYCILPTAYCLLRLPSSAQCLVQLNDSR
jgi:hypothetical protein